MLRNPIALLIGGLAVGFLVGVLLPVSQFETERLKPIADDVKGRVADAGEAAVRRGQAVIKESIEAAQEAMSNG